MTLDIITDLITSYVSQSHYLESEIQTKDVNRYIKYRSLYFRYCGHKVEIRVHNPEFIEVKVGGKFGSVCDCIKSVRDEMDRLTSLRYQW
jgi:hypothetical protein